jgi:hypothetical protein
MRVYAVDIPDVNAPKETRPDSVTVGVSVVEADSAHNGGVPVGYGASAKPSLAEMAALANIEVKIGGVDGSQVEAYVAAGRLTEVADYCLTDMLATYCVFLRYEMVRGDLTPAHLDASMGSLRTTVRKHVERRPLLSAFLKC